MVVVVKGENLRVGDGGLNVKSVNNQLLSFVSGLWRILTKALNCNKVQK